MASAKGGEIMAASRMSSKRTVSPNQGAADMVTRIIRKIKGMQTDINIMGDQLPYINGDSLIDWLRDWDKRAQAKPGGLGRKKAK